MLDPAHRYQTALENVKKDPKGCLESDCPLEQLLALQLAEQAVPTNALHRALEIYQGRRNSKIIMESLLFCVEPVQTLVKRIAEQMNIAPAVVEAYASFFFDPTVFQDMFDRLDYLEVVAGDPDASHYAIKDKTTKQLAMTEGFAYVMSYLKGGSFEYTPVEYMKKLLAIANKYVAQAQNTGIMSKESEKLHKWMTMASKLAISLKALREDSMDDALQDIRIALSYDEQPDSINTLPPDDVLRG